MEAELFTLNVKEPFIPVDGIDKRRPVRAFSVNHCSLSTLYHCFWMLPWFFNQSNGTPCLLAHGVTDWEMGTWRSYPRLFAPVLVVQGFT